MEEKKEQMSGLPENAYRELKEGEEYQPILIIEYYSKLHQEELEKDILKDL